MKLKKIVMTVTKEDILNFLKLQDKVGIRDVIINDKVDILGEYEFLNMKINFQATGEFTKINNNNVYVMVSNFKVLKMNILNSVSKKAFNYVLKAFTDIEGIEFEGDYLKVDISKLIDKYYKDQTFINLNTVQATGIELIDGEIEVTFGGIEIDTSKIQIDSKEAEYVEAEVVGVYR